MTAKEILNKNQKLSVYQSIVNTIPLEMKISIGIMKFKVLTAELFRKLMTHSYGHIPAEWLMQIISQISKGMGETVRARISGMKDKDFDPDALYFRSRLAIFFKEKLSEAPQGIVDEAVEAIFPSAVIQFKKILKQTGDRDKAFKELTNHIIVKTATIEGKGEEILRSLKKESSTSSHNSVKPEITKEQLN
jgi:hypothetical protein